MDDFRCANMSFKKSLIAENLATAKEKWIGAIEGPSLRRLETLTRNHRLSIHAGDLLFIGNTWYVTAAGLLNIAQRKHCAGIHVKPVVPFCMPSQSRWAFKATVFRSTACRGFVGYGDADPTNVSPVVRGAEMRVAETRAVNRALRKAYGIGICSVEEIGSLSEGVEPSQHRKKKPVSGVEGNGRCGTPKLRYRLYHLIRQHKLDPVLVKSYAIDFCGTKTLQGR